jgi:carboxylate-amine ligase
MARRGAPGSRQGLVTPRFGVAPHLAIGLEDELFVLDPVTLELRGRAADVIEKVEAPLGRLKAELHASQVELTTPVCSNADEAVCRLAELRRALLTSGEVVLAAGLHPTDASALQVTRDARYKGVVELLGAAMFRAPEAALHVHVGMADRDLALAAVNGLREQVPLLLALSASSPFREGVDTGWASARAMQIRAYPRWEVPRAFATWDEYEEIVSAVLMAAGIDDYTQLWWLVRPHPRLGTVELRVMDAQPSLDAIRGLAALTQGLAAHAAEAPPVRPLPSEVLNESLFQAARFGLAARLVDPSGAVRPARELAQAAIERAGHALKATGGGVALDEITRILREGTSADRQRLAWARGGPHEVLERLVLETVEPSQQ